MNNLPDEKLAIRRMTLEDIDEVFQIETIAFTLPWSRNSYQFEVSNNPSSRPYVAEAFLKDGSSRIVGMSVIWLILDEAHIANFAIHPGYRGLGIGRKLLATSILDAYKEGARIYYLEVRRSNLTAYRIYKEFGFQVEGIREGYYQDTGEDALLMTLNKVNQPLLTRYATTRIDTTLLSDTKRTEAKNGS